MKDFDSLTPEEKEAYIKKMNKPDLKVSTKGKEYPERLLGPELTKENCSPELWESLKADVKIDDKDLPF